MDRASTIERDLDLRTRPGEGGVEGALTRFDGLAPGESLVVVTSGPATDLLERLQRDRRGAFEWSPLETGPRIWRTEVTRRKAPGGVQRGVLEALAWDHDRLDSLERAAFRARESGDLQSAFDLYSRFAAGLRRHIGFEEDLLVPAFEERAGLPSTAGPTAVMRAEHREIRELLDRIDGSIADAASSPEGLRARFHAVMKDHNEKEEGVLYPSVDELLGPDEADLLVRRIQGYGA
jgi:regulator of cell morphogenesis and NO signaling